MGSGGDRGRDVRRCAAVWRGLAEPWASAVGGGEPLPSVGSLIPWPSAAARAHLMVVAGMAIYISILHTIYIDPSWI